MRRTICTLLVGGVLLSAAACGTAPGSPTPVTGASAPNAGASAPSAIASTCEALGKAYSQHIGVVAESLTTMVTDRKTVTQAQASLAAFATAVTDATKASEDAELKADGKKAGDQLRAKSADKKFFAGIKTTEDVNKAMGPTLTEWLSPISRHCS